MNLISGASIAKQNKWLDPILNFLETVNTDCQLENGYVEKILGTNLLLPAEPRTALRTTGGVKPSVLATTTASGKSRGKRRKSNSLVAIVSDVNLDDCNCAQSGKENVSDLHNLIKNSLTKD